MVGCSELVKEDSCRFGEISIGIVTAGPSLHPGHLYCQLSIKNICSFGQSFLFDSNRIKSQSEVHDDTKD